MTATTAVGGYRHEGLIFEDDADLLAAATPFLRDGVEAGLPTLVRLQPGRERVVLDALGDATGVTVLPMDLMRTPVAALRETFALVSALARGADGDVRLLGEVPHEPWPTWVRYEAACNQVFAELPLLGLCPFDGREAPDQLLADVELTHPLLRRGGATVDNAGYEAPSLMLAGRARLEVDPLEASMPSAELVDAPWDEVSDVVEMVAEGTLLSRESVEALRLASAAVAQNATQHGKAPVRTRVWATLDRVVVAVTDSGEGPADGLIGLTVDPGVGADDAGALHHVYDALGEVSMLAAPDGFTVRMIQRC